MLILHKVFRPFLKGGVHEVDIAGLHQCLLRIQCAVSVSFVATNRPGMDAIAYFDIAVTGKLGRRHNGIFFQSTGDGERLCRGTRFVGIGNRNISPHLIPGNLCAEGRNLLGSVNRGKRVFRNLLAVMLPFILLKSLLFSVFVQQCIRIKGFIQVPRVV